MGIATPSRSPANARSAHSLHCKAPAFARRAAAPAVPASWNQMERCPRQKSPLEESRDDRGAESTGSLETGNSTAPVSPCQTEKSGIASEINFTNSPRRFAWGCLLCGVRSGSIVPFVISLDSAVKCPALQRRLRSATLRRLAWVAPFRLWGLTDISFELGG
jgi:hypothetical protein